MREHTLSTAGKAVYQVIFCSREQDGFPLHIARSSRAAVREYGTYIYHHEAQLESSVHAGNSCKPLKSVCLYCTNEDVRKTPGASTEIPIIAEIAISMNCSAAPASREGQPHAITAKDVQSSTRQRSTRRNTKSAASVLQAASNTNSFVLLLVYMRAEPSSTGPPAIAGDAIAGPKSRTADTASPLVT